MATPPQLKCMQLTCATDAPPIKCSGSGASDRRVVVRPPLRTVALQRPSEVHSDELHQFCRGNLTVSTTGTFTFVFRPRVNSQRRDRPRCAVAPSVVHSSDTAARLRCGLPHRVPRPSRPSTVFLLYDPAARCAVVASRNPTWRCGSV
ncbi:hypothetical protein EVAR_83475_1 [Eumeta japonica]|uniref:Uncharacterized protein n=1 Tax=Eumeta variegata TaxID=151549 RepID=A0A4C1ZE71_EUMVA|nr:hypothetical protein EVAR_83475_1 [Eumeta japonica]